MHPAELCCKVMDAGMSMRANGRDLLLSPGDRLTPELRALLRQNKPAVIRYLKTVETQTANLLATYRRAHRKDAV